MIQEDLQTRFVWTPRYEGAVDAVLLNEWLDESVRNEKIDWLMKTWGNPTRGQTASMIVRRIGYLASIMAYAARVYMVAPNISESALVTFQLSPEDADWFPSYSFTYEEEFPYASFEEWVATELYANWLAPVVDTFAKEKGISKVVLWENISVYIRWVMLDVMGDVEGYEAILHYPTEAFGSGKRHPLAYFHVEAGEPRKTCCLYYQMSDGVGYCSTCPKLKTASEPK